MMERRLRSKVQLGETLGKIGVPMPFQDAGQSTVSSGNHGLENRLLKPQARSSLLRQHVRASFRSEERAEGQGQTDFHHQVGVVGGNQCVNACKLGSKK